MHLPKLGRSVKDECLSKVILSGEMSLARALTEFRCALSFGTRSSGKEERVALPYSAAKDTQS